MVNINHYIKLLNLISPDAMALWMILTKISSSCHKAIVVRYSCAWWPQTLSVNYDWDHPLPHVRCDVYLLTWMKLMWATCSAKLILHVKRSDQKTWEVIWSIYSTIINQVCYHNHWQQQHIICQHNCNGWYLHGDPASGSIIIKSSKNCSCDNN